MLKEACGHGNFVARLEVLNLDRHVAARFVAAAVKFSNVRSNAHLIKAIGNQTKLFEMICLDGDQLEELELTGQTGELALDDVATMSVKELRKAVREAKAEKDATEKLLDTKNKQIDKLSRHIAKATPDDVLLELQKEATAFTNDALGCIRGQLRQAIIALKNHSEADHSPRFHLPSIFTPGHCPTSSRCQRLPAPPARKVGGAQCELAQDRQPVDLVAN